MPNYSTTGLFQLGQIVATPAALQLLEKAGLSPSTFLKRHLCGDWGDLCPEDKELNNAAIANEGNLGKQSRVFSAYNISADEKIYIITEADRSSTCKLLPSDY